MQHIETKTTQARRPTIWGLSLVDLHDRFWATRGVQVVRQGERSQIVDGAELYLLTGPTVLFRFDLAGVLDVLNWIAPDVVVVRLHDRRTTRYRERIISDDEQRFVRCERDYDRADVRCERVMLTTDRTIARGWQHAESYRSGLRHLRRTVAADQRPARSVEGHIYDREQPAQLMQMVRDLIQHWKQPNATISNLTHRNGVWLPADTVNGHAPTPTRGPCWIGAGREADAHTLVGPTVLWDDPDTTPAARQLCWDEIEPSNAPIARPRRLTKRQRRVKRGFDIVFACFALLLTLPLYPLIALAIMIEDGWPIFFAHRRETVGGRTFPCIKFRTMRNNADACQTNLREQNGADGPQFFIDNDPRVTRVGRFLRQTNLDELPQFINVLLGHMAVVGPRPSPYRENQCCPSWREARLSVRPGITGLWQVKRSRRPGLDFQEWIRYDIEYVEHLSLRLDLWIIYATFGVLIRGVLKR